MLRNARNKHLECRFSKPFSNLSFRRIDATVSDQDSNLRNESLNESGDGIQHQFDMGSGAVQISECGQVKQVRP